MTPAQPTTRPSVAVVGSGVSGLTAAYALRESHDVTLLEADDRLGGHAHTHQVPTSAGTLGVDSGFIVHNDRTYPHLRRLFAELGVDVHATEMSMSIQGTANGLEYAGGRGARGIFAQRRRVADPRFLALLAQVKRFQVLAGRLLDAQDDGSTALTYGEFLRRHRFSPHFVTYYAIPVVSCVWSSGHDVALEYPARYLFAFLRHHGFLTLGDSPQWFTVVGGSATYVERLAARLPDVRRGHGALSVLRDADGVTVDVAGQGPQRFDQVVLATHADDALGLLADATPDEKRVLGAFTYSQNETVLHTDASLLPSAPEARAAWNYRTDGTRAARTQVTYWMNRLQGLDCDEQLLVTLNASDVVDPSRVIATMQYEHPVYTPASVAAQGELGSLTTDRTAFAGAYHGWGFHEDGCRSGIEAARALGATWPSS